MVITPFSTMRQVETTYLRAGSHFYYCGNLQNWATHIKINRLTTRRGKRKISIFSLMNCSLRNWYMSVYLSLYFLLPCALKETTMACSSPTLNDSSSGVTEKLSSASLCYKWHTKDNYTQRSDMKIPRWEWDIKERRKFKEETLKT